MRFQEWLDEIENFSTRYERLTEDFDDLSTKGYIVLLKWLEAAYQVGYDHALSKTIDDGK